MNIHATFFVPSHVIAREVGDEAVLLDLASGTYFGLDPVGACVWRIIESGKSLAEACDQVIEVYDVERDVLEQDVIALAHDLIEKKLLNMS